MVSADEEFRSFRFSTDDVAERDRIAMFRDVYARSMVNHAVEPLAGSPLHFSATFQTFPGLAIAAGAISALDAVRTARDIDSDGIVLNISLAGGRIMRQRRREAVVQAGEAVVAAGDEPGIATIAEASRFISLRLPRTAIVPLVSDLDRLTVRTIPRTSEALRLLIGYLSVIQDSASLARMDVRRLVAGHVHDLVALVLGASRDAAEAARGGGVRAARLVAVKADIAANLTRRDLTTDALARRHSLSPRSIRNLFGSMETTFTDFVLGERLARVHRMLSDPRFAGHTISALAFEAGFGDLSYFNHAFRRRYGATPSDVRNQVVPTVPGG
jgi:AraC-like DNA-binding protein